MVNLLNKTISMNRPLIFVTNDDSINSDGIKKLISIAQLIGDVFVVAPDSPKSGKSHAISLDSTITLDLIKKQKGLTIYTCSGMPVDCVKLGLDELVDRKPDLLLSGINHGSNAATNIIYSGTMAGALEGAMHQIPSIGFSLLDIDPNADFEPCTNYVHSIINLVLEKKELVCLNVNIPVLEEEKIKGIKMCSQSMAYWKEHFESFTDEQGKLTYQMRGTFINLEQNKDSDQWALDKDYISVVPVNFDFTDYKMLDKLKNWKL